MAIKPDHSAIKLKQSRKILKIGNWRSAARNCNCAHPIRKFPGGRICVRRSTRHGENMKTLETKVVRKLFDDFGPVDQPSILLKSRIANSGAVGRNDSYPELSRSLLGELR